MTGVVESMDCEWESWLNDGGGIYGWKNNG